MMHKLSVFSDITQAIEANGYCVIDDALPANLAQALHQHISCIPSQDFKGMGVGRGDQLHVNQDYRSDTSYWLNHQHISEKDYALWMEELRLAVNQHLFLGLVGYEAHFAHYAPQSFYKRHTDAFKGRSNRKLTTVYYLNPDWNKHDGGELLIYANKDCKTPFKTISPNMNRLVVFLSDEFPHEVLPAQKGRYSIAGWFQGNL